MNNDRFQPTGSAGRSMAQRSSFDVDGGGGGEAAIPGDASRKKFPWALHTLLEDAEKAGDSGIVSWNPSGTAFQVIKRDEFMKRILPGYFKQTKFKSFVRQLSLWGFTYQDDGPDKGCYYHSKFVRGKPNLCNEMKRQKVKGSSVHTGNPPKPNPQHMGTISARTTSNLAMGSNIPSSLALGSDTISMGPYDLGNERITSGLSYGGDLDPIAYPNQPHQSQSIRASQYQIRSSSLPQYPPRGASLFNTNESNSNIMYRNGPELGSNESPLESNDWSDTRLSPPERGDWFDRLEAMFDASQIPVGNHAARTASLHPSLFEPRPIRSPQNVAKKKAGKEDEKEGFQKYHGVFD